MDEFTTSIISKKNENFFFARIKKYQVVTFTLGFLFFYRFVGTLIFYFVGKETFLETYNLSVWFFIIAIPVVYFIQWLIATWGASKFTSETLKEKFYHHPIATIIFIVLYLTDLPYRLSESNLGGGLIKFINAFEIVIYYAFISFLWWLLICWISSKIWKRQRFQWDWYKKTIDKIFIVIPLLYKFILGLIVTLLLFIILFLLITKIFHYSGSDIMKLFNY
ncbi:MAG: hypothetical protein J7J70_08360 [Deltaproteobacteria bacterium]|nr:hypothetical protein [Candidatus Tharpellaceae bacterium]